MKINNIEISEPNVEELYLPRGKNVLRIIAKGVIEDEDFEKLCPKPIPPIVIKPTVGRVQDVENPDYKLQLSQWAENKFNWLIIQSLRSTEGLEWEQVQYDQPGTWHLWSEELKKIFTAAEIQKIIDTVTAANGMNEKRIEQARQSFTHTREEQQKQLSSRMDGQENTPSGVPVNGLASNRQESDTKTGTS